MEPKQNDKPIAKEEEHLSPQTAEVEKQQLEPSANAPLQTDSNEKPSLLQHPQEPPTSNVESKTSETMEVHHHGHVHEKKKWKEYVFQFLMLFLAVFCGFLAENEREHIVEQHRAKDYAKSLLNDLKEDTAEIAGGIRQNTFMIKAFDSCISIGMKNIDKPIVSGKFYYYSRFATNAYGIDWNESTLTQLLQSGNLRYFKNKDLVNKINKYHSLIGVISNNNETDLLHRNVIGQIRSRLLVPKYYEPFSLLQIEVEMKGHIPNDAIDSLMSEQALLKPGSTDTMEEFLNNLMERKSRNKRFINELYPKALKAASEIIETLKEEYHLK